MLITRLDNLSIYVQDDTRRRSIIDNPKRDRVENLESVNEAYVVEDYDCTCLIENIEMLEQEPEPEAGQMSDAEIARIASVAASVVKAMSESGTAQAQAESGTGTGSAGA